MSTPSPRREQLLPALAALIVLCAYWGSWHGGFVFDDRAMVVEHALVGDLSRLPEMFTTDLWEASGKSGWQSGYYRPLVLVDLAIDRALFGLSPAAFHLHSLAWHLLSVVLGWGLFRRLLPAGAAFAATLLFGLHPAGSEAVVWIAARNDVMALALALLALRLVLPADVGVGRMAAAAFASAAALLSKESVVLLPLWLACLDLAAGVDPRRAWKRYVAIAVGLVAVLGLRGLVGVAASAASGPEGWAAVAAGLPGYLGTVGASVVCPWPLSLGRHISWIHDEPAWRVGIGLVGVLVLVVAPLSRRGRERRVALAGLAWAMVAIAPTVFAVASRALYGDRYVYAGLVGVALLFGAVLGRAALPTVLVLAVPAVWVVRDRLPDWQSDHSLFAAAVEDSPNPWVHMRYGDVLREEGRDAEAVEHYVAALRADPPGWGACVSVIRASIEAGALEQARAHARAGLDLGCPSSGAHLGLLAMLELRLGNPQGAVEIRARAGERRDPAGWDQSVDAGLARLQGDEGRYQEVVAEWSQSRSLEGDVAWLLAGYTAREEP